MNAERRYDLIAFDVDGTLVDDTVFVWETLHNFFNTDPESRDMAFDNYMSGKWVYEQWFEHDMKLLTEAGATRATILEAIAGMRLTEGALETLVRLRQSGARLAIISGSIDIVVEKFGLADYFDEVFLNRIWFDDSGRLQRWRATPYDVWDKATGLRTLAEKYGVPMERTAFIGDNFNDVAVAKAAGFSLAIHCKSDELAETVDVVIEEDDMRAVLPYLLGKES